MLVLCSGTIVMFGALVVFWVVTRMPDMSQDDVRAVLSSLVATSQVTRGAGRESFVRPSWTTGVIASPSIAFAFLDIERRHAVRLLVGEVAADALPLRERLVREPSPYARRALDQFDETLVAERVRLCDADARSCADACRRLEDLRRHVRRLGGAVFDLDVRLRSVRELLARARGTRADQDAASALGELEDRVDALAVTDVWFTHPETIEGVGHELGRIREFLLRWEAEATTERDRSPRDDDPCATLGVSRDATAEDIRAAYRAKIAQCHPDRVAHRIAMLTGDAEVQQLLREWFTERAQRLNDAYRVLTTTEGTAHA